MKSSRVFCLLFLGYTCIPINSLLRVIDARPQVLFAFATAETLHLRVCITVVHVMFCQCVYYEKDEMIDSFIIETRQGRSSSHTHADVRAQNLRQVPTCIPSVIQIVCRIQASSGELTRRILIKYCVLALTH